ncbi:MAG: class I SAM-dependent methyltransferase [Actinomycetota bacterium]|nr:class I SAM-dependent methyltransferase [Actinomycetota bacterium]
MNDAISYQDVLDRLHQALAPRTYLEIGVRHGDALVHALPGTKVVGVDPRPNILRPLPKGAKVERVTSDEFFTRGLASHHFGTLPVDLAFIDGMHLYENALRDFFNVERVSSRNSVVLLHDCLPPSAEVATREVPRGCWTGDVWKVLLYLRDNRPDLDICVFDAEPTGLGVIQGLDPDRPAEEFESLARKYRDLDFSSFSDDLLPSLDVVRGWPAMRCRVPPDPWRQVDDLSAAIVARSSYRPSLATYARRFKRAVLQTGAGLALAKARASVRR